jgi:ribosome-associated protein
MIKITPEISINEDEIEEEFIHASGPGGQHVNKVATAVQLRFNMNSTSIPNDVLDRLINLAGRRINKQGILTIRSAKYRSQDRNRKEALNRLIDLIRKAAQKPKKRRETRPTDASKKKRLELKRKRGTLKELRKPVKSDFTDDSS